MTAGSSGGPTVGDYFKRLAGVVRQAVSLWLLVGGGGLWALTAVVLLDGFGVMDLGLTASMAGLLGSALVLGTVGALALGLASEGPGLPNYPERGQSVAFAFDRAIGSLLIGIAAAIIFGRLHAWLPDLPEPFTLGVQWLRAVGWGGAIGGTIVGSALTWALYKLSGRRSWATSIEFPLLFLVWAVSSMVAFLRIT